MSVSAFAIHLWSSLKVLNCSYSSWQINFSLRWKLLATSMIIKRNCNTNSSGFFIRYQQISCFAEICLFVKIQKNNWDSREVQTTKWNIIMFDCTEVLDERKECTSDLSDRDISFQPSMKIREVILPSTALGTDISISVLRLRGVL